MSILKEIYRKIIGHGTELLGLDLRYFASGGFWTTLGQSINGIISFLLIIIFANLLPKETYGLYRYILSLAGILNIFTLTGMNAAVVQAVASGNEGAFKTSVKYQFKWNLAMMAAMLGLSAYYFWQNNITLAISMFVLGISSPFTAALNTYGGFLEGKRQFKLNNIFGVISTALYAGSIIIALAISREATALIIAYSASTFAANLFFYFKTIKIFNPPETPSRGALSYGRKLTYINLISPIVGQIDNIVLAHFWGPAQLAVYSLARAMPDKIAPFIKDIVNLGLPKLAPKTIEDIEKVFYKRIFQAMLFGAVLTAGYIAAAPFVFKYILPKYLESILYSQFLAAMFIFSAPIGYTGAVFTSQKLLTRPLFVASGIVMNTTKIVLFIIFGIFGGIWGLILASVSYSILSVVSSIIVWEFRGK